MKDIFQNLIVTVVVSGSISFLVNIYNEANKLELPATNVQLERLLEVVKTNPELSGRLAIALEDEKISYAEAAGIVASVESGAERKQLIEDLKLLAK